MKLTSAIDFYIEDARGTGRIFSQEREA